MCAVRRARPAEAKRSTGCNEERAACGPVGSVSGITARVTIETCLFILFVARAVCLPRFVPSIILQQARPGLVRRQYPQHLESGVVRHFLRVARGRHGFVLWRVAATKAEEPVRFHRSSTVRVLTSNARKTNVPQSRQRHVLDVDPPNFEHAFPLVRRPDVRARLVVDRRQHLGHASKVTAVHNASGKSGFFFSWLARSLGAPAIDGKEQVDRSLVRTLAERPVQPFVP